MSGQMPNAAYDRPLVSLSKTAYACIRFELLKDEERSQLPKPRTDFAPIARLETLLTPLNRLLQMVSDSKLQWSAEAYDQTLEADHAAKSRMDRNDKLAKDIKPFIDYFSALTLKASALAIKTLIKTRT